MSRSIGLSRLEARVCITEISMSDSWSCLGERSGVMKETYTANRDCRWRKIPRDGLYTANDRSRILQTIFKGGEE